MIDPATGTSVKVQPVSARCWQQASRPSLIFGFGSFGWPPLPAGRTPTQTTMLHRNVLAARLQVSIPLPQSPLPMASLTDTKTPPIWPQPLWDRVIRRGFKAHRHLQWERSCSPCKRREAGPFALAGTYSLALNWQNFTWGAHPAAYFALQFRANKLSLLAPQETVTDMDSGRAHGAEPGQGRVILAQEGVHVAH